MNSYYVGVSESLLGLGRIYTEFKGSMATRQVEYYNGTWYSSRDEYHEGKGPSLYDGALEDLDMSSSIEISKDEFELVWSASK